ncbi:MAG: D-lyxose/D-mannose family sugar isomerase [Devosia sp.]
MKRSAIEAAIAEAAEAFDAAGLALPPFATWSVETWRAHAGTHAYTSGLGWDVTDFGGGKFDALGLTLFSMRNGSAEELAAGRGFSYAEKALYVKERQLTPLHRHNIKVEDIIVRGTGTLALKLRKSAADGVPGPAARLSLQCDGMARETDEDGILRLTRGESVTLTTDIWHAFWAEGGPVVVGEVSSVNDDATDNVFAEPLPRFPSIEEDVPAKTLLAGER